jgi:hypothetical protein
MLSYAPNENNALPKFFPLGGNDDDGDVLANNTNRPWRIQLERLVYCSPLHRALKLGGGGRRGGGGESKEEGDPVVSAVATRRHKWGRKRRRL